MKLGPLGRFVTAALLTATSFGGCGYRSALAPAQSGRWSVAAAPFATPDVAAVSAVLSGARDELARADALGTAAYPRLVIEVLRVDELPAGIQATGDQPLGRGSTVGVIARGWVEEREGGSRLRDTGDVRRVETVSQGADPVGSAISAADAMQAAARRTGQALALRALGRPEAASEPL